MDSNWFKKLFIDEAKAAGSCGSLNELKKIGGVGYTEKVFVELYSGTHKTGSEFMMTHAISAGQELRITINGKSEIHVATSGVIGNAWLASPYNKVDTGEDFCISGSGVSGKYRCYRLHVRKGVYPDEVDFKIEIAEVRTNPINSKFLPASSGGLATWDIKNCIMSGSVDAETAAFLDSCVEACVPFVATLSAPEASLYAAVVMNLSASDEAQAFLGMVMSPDGPSPLIFVKSSSTWAMITG